jgi:integrase
MRRLYGSGGNPSNATLGAYLHDWLRSWRDVRESTLTSYEGHVRLHINPLLGGIPLIRLQAADVRRLVDELHRKRLKPATIGRVITTLRIALNAAVADEILPSNPAAHVKLPRVDREPVTPLTDEDADRILEAVAGHWCERIVRVLLGSGMRLGEAIGLNQGDIGEGFVRLRVTKTQVRAVLVTDDAMDALRSSVTSAPRRGPNEPVFFGPRKRDRLRGDSVTHVLPRLLERAGVSRLSPHGLRHGAATIMLSAGVPMRAISEQLGHRNPALTARVYAHVAPALRDSAVAALERRKAR